MANKIFAFVAASGSGKTTMVEAAVKRLAGQLQVVRSTTTRASRGSADDMHYRHYSREQFQQAIAQGKLDYHVEYAGNFYGILASDLDDLLAKSHGILALVEESVRLLRARGYDVRVMKIIKKGAPEFPDALRNKVDAERERDPLKADVVIVNEFDRPDGLQRATDQMVAYIQGAITSADTAANAATTK